MKSYLKEVGKYPTPTHQDYLDYYNSPTESLRDKLITGNLQLVYQQGKKYQKYLSTEIFEDVIFEGNLGLIKAVDKFNPNKGYKFSTYAAFWIVQSMISFMKQNSGIVDNTISLDNVYTNLDEDSENNFIDSLAQEEPDTKNLDNYYLTKKIHEFKEVLSLREYDILCYYYGVDGYKEMDINEMAKRLDYSHETVRLIKETALNKVRRKYNKNDF
jgi:RNA polymerase sigma factor (sigma-70 family)